MADLNRLQAVYRFWPNGMDSWTAPFAVPQSAYVYGQNVMNKGGIPQTRPGSRSLACMPTGNAQGVGMFTPENGVTHLMAAVNGVIWVSPQPFLEWRQLVGLTFNPNSKFITFVECIKTTDYDADGELFYLDLPYRIVIIQDGNTRAAFWDGSNYQHLNPTPSNAELTVDNRDETKIGLWGTYSNNRYWVARGRFVFASDIGNPLKFHESQYINEAPAFVLEDDCTGMIESPDRSGILCFYEDGADFLLTSIQDRTQWLTRASDFQRKVLNVGCIAPRSLVNQNGLLYWFSNRGWISQNEAERAFITSVLNPLDDQMAYSKSRIGPNLTRIAAGSIENISLVSVPFCSLKNTHTWCLDSLPLQGEEAVTAWASVWTGWRPVCWVSGNVDGYERIFFLSSDTDGQNRVWEGFTADHKDNGCDITCFVQFRQDDFNDPIAMKRFRFAEVELGQLAGTVSAMVTVAGSRGWFERILTHDIVATFERIDYEQTYGEGTAEYPLMASSRKQSRIIRSEEWIQPNDCNACGVEGQRPVNFDYAFSVWVGWSGRAAITRLNMVATEETENQERGTCEVDEVGPNVLDGGGCSAKELYPVLEEAFPKYFATSIQTLPNIFGIPVTWEASAFSQISQKDAQRRADCKAFQQLLLLPQFDTRVAALLVYNEAGTELIGDLIDFGYFLAGQTGDITVRLVSAGEGILELGAITIPDSLAFTIIDGPQAVSLDPGDFTFLTLRFDGSAEEGENVEEIDPPIITSALTASGNVGTPFFYQITAENIPNSYGASPLPAGLSIDPATGIISGTPTTDAITNIEITATNAGGTDTEILVLTVSPAAVPFTGSSFAAADFTAAYGFRQLIAGYSGSLFTLRRDSDDATQTFDVGYDQAAPTAFLGGANGYVTALFDQTGNGRHMTQGAGALQPIFTLAAPGGYPAMQNTVARRAYLAYAGTNPCATVVSILRIDSGDAGGAIISHQTSESPSIRNVFGPIGTWDTFDFANSARVVNGIATPVYTPGNWHCYRAVASANRTFPNPHILFNASLSLSRTLSGYISEMLTADLSKGVEATNASTDLITFWGL